MSGRDEGMSEGSEERLIPFIPYPPRVSPHSTRLAQRPEEPWNGGAEPRPVGPPPHAARRVDGVR